MEDLEVYKEYVELVEQELYSFLKRSSTLSNYYDYLLYHFGFKSLNGESFQPAAARLLGKRLRPVMCMLIYRSITGTSEDYHRAIPLVLSAEMLHNASLIHDDIQDHDELRWGRPTLWKLFGVEQGINCGDSLQGMAYQSILELTKKGYSDALVIRILASSNRIHTTVVEGQYLDLLFEKRLDISEFEYFEMISRKTAAPFAGVAECAAVLATNESDQGLIDSYKNFAMKFGILFQLTDDILGIWGDVRKTGKTPADIRNKKKTLPVIYAFNRASDNSKQRLVELYSNNQPIDEQEAFEVLSILEETRSRELCLEWIKKYYDETLEALQGTKMSNDFHEKLVFMADYCYKRSQVFSEAK